MKRLTLSHITGTVNRPGAIAAMRREQAVREELVVRNNRRQRECHSERPTFGKQERIYNQEH